MDGFENLDAIDRVQNFPNSFENIIMSNIDRTLHGDFDSKTSVLDSSEVNLVSSPGVSVLNNKSEAGLSASKLRQLQESTMIGSALDLDTLEEQSVVSVNSGNSSQTGLLKCTPASAYQ